ncbi:MAG: SDR family oxidoreductase [Polaromonas sp.]|nr:SDR family oxidoreductase [Polaromonas sp.]
MKKILVTGATGYLGASLLRHLCVQGYCLTAVSRRKIVDMPSSVVTCIVDGLGTETDWSVPLRGQDVVVHCAARVHVVRDTSLDPLEAFRAVNLHGTINLARQAKEAGVKRFIFLSSVGVNGAETFDAPFSESDVALPHSPYAVSKHEAEVGLRLVAEQTGLEVVIIRPPLVYGAGAPGNFQSLVRWLLRGVPLPLGAIKNRRSYVALGNLVDLLVVCLDHPAAANQTFLVSDGEDLSTTDLLTRMGTALGKPATLLSVPMVLLKFGATVLGKRDIAQRLCGSLQVDGGKARRLLGWTPPLSVDEGLRQAAEGYLREASI